ncbi:protein HEAT INTOLERANT [Trifolium repens]|nr:protein HEAT INTOLERANT [Trifolium repens]
MINNTCPFYILPEFTDKLIEAEELLDDQKGAFKEFVKEMIQEAKRANREENISLSDRVGKLKDTLVVENSTGASKSYERLGAQQSVLELILYDVISQRHKELNYR